MDTPQPWRFVRVVKSLWVGTDSILTVVDPADPDWPGAKFSSPILARPGDDGYVRFVPGRSVLSGRKRLPDGWAFRPAGDTVETGRPEAGCPAPDGSGPAGDTKTAIVGGDHEAAEDRGSGC